MSAPPPAYYPPPGEDTSGKAGYPPPAGQAQYPVQQGQYPPPNQGAYPTQQQPYPAGQQPYPGQQVQQPYPGQQPYPPPTGPGYAGGAGQQQSTIIVAVPTLTVQHGAFSNSPMQTTCPSCHATVLTSVSHEVGAMAWVIFAVLCLVGCWICAFIPFCVDDCKDTVHSCPNCNAIIGRHKRL
jgi:lipopolysaccharide-induced tumor necrosis factor-alpha factor